VTEKITFVLDGKQVEASPDETIWQVAQRQGTKIPHLCYAPEPGYRADGNCRACMVEIKGERVLAASCIRKPVHDMVVNTASDEAKSARRMVMEMLVADQPARETAHDPDSKFWTWADAMGVTDSRFPARPKTDSDASHVAIAVNLDACIHCNLCVRACREVQVNDVIGMAYRGHGSKIVFDFDDPMGDSTCVACGECVQACPTGALMEANLLDDAGTRREFEDRHVDTLCPYCGVGCQTRAHVKDDKILYVDGRNGPANEQRLCVKGRFGFDYITHADRLTKPLIRRDDAPKDGALQLDPANPWTHFREASWEEALDRAATGLKNALDEKGASGLAGFGSAKGSNEEAYLFQKLVRTGFGTNNVDHCTRLCHASSVAALMEGIGSGAVTAPFTAADEADCIIVIGARPEQNHPVAATYLKNRAKQGAKLIVADPRGQGLGRHASYNLQFKAGMDVALLNAMIHTIVEEELYDRDYLQSYAEGFDELAERVKAFPPEKMAEVCGIEAQTIRDVARLYATSSNSIIFWGMGISQSVHGTDNARGLIALALITGHVGRPGTGLHPLRGQNNVQGASDAGLIPMFFPDYKSVEDDDNRQRYEDFWGTELDPKRGREPGDVGSGSGACACGAGQAGTPRGAGYLPHRDGLAGGRRVAGISAPGKNRHLHQYQPAGPARPRSRAAAGRHTPGLVDHAGDRAAYGAGLELHAPPGRLCGDDGDHAVAGAYHLGAPRARGRGDLSLRCTRQTGERHHLRCRFSDDERPRQDRPNRAYAAGRAAG
jgi:formate dehydrogenase major subunit